MSLNSKTVNYIFIYIIITYPIHAVFPESSHLNKHKASYLPDTDFGDREYVEYQDEDVNNIERIVEAESHLGNVIPVDTSPKSFLNQNDQLDPNIKWDSKYADKIAFGQVSAVSIDPQGNVVVFHRGNRVWGYGTFDETNRFDQNLGPIKENTIVMLDKNGKIILEWGANMFYLPHGLTIDSEGNYWITDVAMHQVFKFDAKEIEEYTKQSINNQFNLKYNNCNYNNENLFESSIIKPSIILGEAFVPGNDDSHFCKPTAVAVCSNGDFFVSDGYCNSRIIKYNAKGEQILKWGRRWTKSGILTPNAFDVPHALALAEELNYILVADREHGRILCFYLNNGEFHREYTNPIIGTKIFSIAHACNKIYLVNGPDTFLYNYHVRGYILDIKTGNIISQFGPGGDMNQPHDIAVSNNGKEIYVADLNIKKIYKFTQGINNSKGEQCNNSSLSYPELASLSESKTSNEAVTLLLSILIATVIFIILCLIMAVVLARCRKRGSSYYEQRVEFTKLVQ